MSQYVLPTTECVNNCCCFHYPPLAPIMPPKALTSNILYPSAKSCKPLTRRTVQFCTNRLNYVSVSPFQCTVLQCVALPEFLLWQKFMNFN